jgi:hypothetical protein
MDFVLFLDRVFNHFIADQHVNIQPHVKILLNFIKIHTSEHFKISIDNYDNLADMPLGIIDQVLAFIPNLNKELFIESISAILFEAFRIPQPVQFTTPAPAQPKPAQPKSSDSKQTVISKNPRFLAINVITGPQEVYYNYKFVDYGLSNPPYVEPYMHDTPTKTIGWHNSLFPSKSSVLPGIINSIQKGSTKIDINNKFAYGVFWDEKKKMILDHTETIEELIEYCNTVSKVNLSSVKECFWLESTLKILASDVATKQLMLIISYVYGVKYFAIVQFKELSKAVYTYEDEWN